MTPPEVRRIEDSRPRHANTSWIAAVLCLLAAGAVLAAIGFPPVIDPNDPEFTPAVLLPAILVVVSGIQAVKGLRGLRGGRRFGASVFEMEGDRVGPGGTLCGRVRTSRDLAPPAGFRLRLACTETVTIPDSAGSTIGRIESKLRYEVEGVVAGSTSSARDGIPVRLPMPRRSIEPARLSRRLEWTLEVRAEVEGARYEALFAVPAAN